MKLKIGIFLFGLVFVSMPVSGFCGGGFNFNPGAVFGGVSAGAGEYPSFAAPEPVPSPSGKAAADYADYYDALEYFSEMALRVDQESAEYMEIYMAGNYLREKVDALEGRIGPGAAARLRFSSRGKSGFYAPSRRVMEELNRVFPGGDFVRSSRRKEISIRNGYAKIAYVRNGKVPFLVQRDSFLKRREVILTFDDGPSGKNSSSLASYLAGEGAESVFFVLGSRFSESGAAALRAESAGGHYVAVHGYHHATPKGSPFTAYPDRKVAEIVSRVAASIEKATGRRALFFRPPYGIVSPGSLEIIMNESEIAPVGWTIDTMDWSIKSPDELFAKTVELISRRGKGIILMHDTHSQSRIVARKLVKWLKANNYRIVSPMKIYEAFRAAGSD